MWNRRLTRTLSALGVAVFLAAPPTLAAPSPDAGVPARVVQVLAGWWGELTQPLVSVFQPNGHGIDPDGQPTATDGTDDPTADPQHRATIDPNG
ncbi:MAG TPA: hypothetical protein VMR44_03065 [Thermoanaerobaculia bacterium]|nr:hypothetical protein [Thermoanaerobaculia bacterium]